VHGDAGADVEVILAERLGDGTPPVERACVPDGIVRVRLPKTATLPRLLGAALEQARGEIIAITDTHCEIDDGWVQALLRAHESAHSVIGGAVEPGALRRLVDWAAYLAEYGQFMLPLTEGIGDELPGNNISMKRWALEHGREFVQGEFWKTHWCRQLQAEGLQLQQTPGILVCYGCAYTLFGFLTRRFHHGRCFAGMRLRRLRGLRRAAYLAGSPALPMLLLFRMLRAVLAKRRRIDKLVLSLPIIVLGMFSWAAGELIGYLSGPGRSCRHVR
jgi:hypothetical protein